MKKKSIVGLIIFCFFKFDTENNIFESEFSFRQLIAL